MLENLQAHNALRVVRSETRSETTETWNIWKHLGKAWKIWNTILAKKKNLLWRSLTQNLFRCGTWPNVYQQGVLDKYLRTTAINCKSTHLSSRFHFPYTFKPDLCLSGYCRDRRGQGSVRHHPDRRQLQQHRQSGDVGTQRLRQHLQVPPVSADRQRGGRYRGLHWGVHHSGIHRRSEWGECWQTYTDISTEFEIIQCSI